VKPWPLRATLTLSYAGVIALLLVASGLLYYHAFARQLDADATMELRDMTSGVRGYIRFEGGGPTLTYDRSDPDQATFVQEATRYYQVYDANSGRLVVQSPALEPLGVHYTPNEVRAFRNQLGVFDVQTDHGRIRMSNSLLSPTAAEAYLVQVGVSLDQQDAALERFVSLLLWSLPISLLVVAVVGSWMAARALAPLARLAALTRTFGVASLHRRLPVRGAGDELDALAQAFNDVVARLERAVGEMRQFSAAMAHELRTPLAIIRGEIELSATDARLPDEHRRRLAGHLEEIDKLARLVTRLLTLVQAEAGEIPLARDAVDLAALSAMVVDALEPVAHAKHIWLAGAEAGGVVITGDRGWMERLLLNLLDNAIKFTPPGGTITVSVTREGNRARLAVRDTGVGMTADVLPHVFERFYRADAARSSQPHGAGLGLSLVKWIADRHGATIDVTSRPGSGSTFTLSVPLRDVRTAGAAAQEADVRTIPGPGSVSVRV
jgi:heavy metal sensor kinase